MKHQINMGITFSISLLTPDVVFWMDAGMQNMIISRESVHTLGRSVVDYMIY